MTLRKTPPTRAKCLFYFVIQPPSSKSMYKKELPKARPYKATAHHPGNCWPSCLWHPIKDQWEDLRCANFQPIFSEWQSWFTRSGVWCEWTIFPWNSKSGGLEDDFSFLFMGDLFVGSSCSFFPGCKSVFSPDLQVGTQPCHFSG